MMKACLFLGSILCAAPTGFQPIEGDAAITASTAKWMEVSCGKEAVIQWDTFSIGTDEALQFLQPGPDSVVVNRIIGSLPSHIDGSLQALGHVYLLNPSGILFGANARIDVGTLIASTLDLLKSSDQLNFKGDSQEAVVNLGKIRASSGDVILAARYVKNDGAISAPNGDVLLASGLDIILSPKGRERIFVALKGTEKEGTGVDQTGTIEAICTEIQADGSLYELAINSGGAIDALAVEEKDGVIHLVAREGRIQESGSLHAAGGQVHLFGREVILDDSSLIDVSSRTGNGGEVIALGSEANAFFGTILAEGGPEGGDGGFVEISSPGYLAMHGKVSTFAPNGATGRLYLDPVAVNITASDANYTYSAPYYTFGNAPGASILNTSLQTNLGLSNVIIDASGHGGNAAFGSITFSSAVTWASTNSLTLIANDGPSSFVAFNANVTPTSAAFAAGTNSIVIDSPTVYCGNGSQTAVVTVNSTSGNILVTGDLYVQGGSTGTANFRAGSGGNSGSIVVNGDAHILGGAPNAVANLRVFGSGSNITINGDVLMQAGNATVGTCDANLQTNGGALTINGNLSMLAGTDPVTQSSTAFIDADTAIINGNVYMAGGNGTAGGSAECYFDFLTCEVNGNLTMLGGNTLVGAGGARCLFEIGESIIRGDVFMQAGLSDNDSSVQLTSGSGRSITIQGNLTMIGGSGTGISNALIATASGGDITIQGEQVTLTAGSATTDGSVLIDTNGANGNLSIDLTGDCTLTASPTTGNSAIIDVDTSGTFTINCRNLTLTSGSQMNAVADCFTRSGDVNIHCTGNCLLDSTLGAATRIRTLGSDFTLIADGSITLLGPASLSIVAPTGNLLAIAGKDFFVGSGAAISISGIGSIDLVCDNQAPSFPEFGNGRFTLQSGGTITNGGGGPVRIFSVTQSLNSIGGPINGASFIPGAQFANSDQEQWGVYYFNAFFGGPGFTIFYKLSPANSSLASLSNNQMLWYLDPIGILCDSYFQLHRINAEVTPLMRSRRFEQVGRIVTPPAYMKSPFVAENFEISEL